MNVYEEAHNLSNAIKNSNEFLEFDKLRKEAEQDDQLKTMLKQFHEAQLQLQAAQLSGNNDPNLMNSIQSLYTVMMGNPKAAEYLQAEARFSIMMKDVMEILGDAMNLSSML